MSILEQIQLRARILSRELTEGELALLQAAAQAAVAELTANLKDGVTPEDCGDSFITAGAMVALANMSQVGDGTGIEQFTAGDMTVRRGTANTAASCLRFQAYVLLGEHMQSGLAFLGV